MLRGMKTWEGPFVLDLLQVAVGEQKRLQIMCDMNLGAGNEERYPDQQEPQQTEESEKLVGFLFLSLRWTVWLLCITLSRGDCQ